MKKPKNKIKKKKSVSGPPTFKKRRSRYVWLNVLPDDLWVKVLRGKTVWEALQGQDVELEGECGGLGKCGKCKVRVISSIKSPSEEEKELLSEEELNEGVRLACRIPVKKDLVIHTAEDELHQKYYQILKTGHRPVLYIDPLVEKKPLSLSSELKNENTSDLDMIKILLGPQYKDLQATLHCLRTLPQMLKKTDYQGAAVLHDNCLLAWEPVEKMDRRYGLAFDLGTSTLVGKLFNLSDGTEVAVISMLNSQSKCGTNVISRLQYVQQNEKGLETLNRLLLEDLNRIIRRLLKASELKPDDIYVAVAAGNTTIQHLLLKLDPSGIGEAPFAPVVKDGLILKAEEVGLKIHPEARIHIMPAKTGYIGGDLISVVLASEAAKKDEIVLGLDLGTNGEIFLGNKKQLMTCSAAAGPALEGAGITHGMIARAGAIEGARLEDEQLKYRVIGNINPTGICGSGLVDIIAVLLHCGIIDYEGAIRPSQECADGDLLSRIVRRPYVQDFLVASADESFHNTPIYLTQKDVREVQFTKAAIEAGIKILMDEMAVEAKNIDKVYLAGALGNYINPYSAVRIGLIPDVDPRIIESLGNAAGTGASMVLLSKEYWKESLGLTGTIEHIELSSRLDFNEYFVECMDFPKENIW